MAKPAMAAMVARKITLEGDAASQSQRAPTPRGEKWGRGGAHHEGTRTSVGRSRKGAAHGTGRRLCFDGQFEDALDDLAAALALSENGARASIHFQRGEVLSAGTPGGRDTSLQRVSGGEPGPRSGCVSQGRVPQSARREGGRRLRGCLALDAAPDPEAPSPSLQRRPSLRLGVDAYAAKLEEDATKGACAHFDRAYAYDASNDLAAGPRIHRGAPRAAGACAGLAYNRGICRQRLGDAAALDDFTQAIQRAEAPQTTP